MFGVQWFKNFYRYWVDEIKLAIEYTEYIQELRGDRPISFIQDFMLPTLQCFIGCLFEILPYSWSSSTSPPVYDPTVLLAPINQNFRYQAPPPSYQMSTSPMTPHQMVTSSSDVYQIQDHQLMPPPPVEAPGINNTHSESSWMETPLHVPQSTPKQTNNFHANSCQTVPPQMQTSQNKPYQITSSQLKTRFVLYQGTSLQTPSPRISPLKSNQMRNAHRQSSRFRSYQIADNCNYKLIDIGKARRRDAYLSVN